MAQGVELLRKIRGRLAALVAPPPAPTAKAKKKKRPTLRAELHEVMAKIAEPGFVPGTVIDVGFNTGTPGLYDRFPEAHYLMVDPLAESELFMKYQKSKLKRADYVVAAAGACEGTLELGVTPDFGGTSAFMKGSTSAETRQVPMVTLDQLVERFGCKGPYLIKIDVQGAELEVLKGAATILAETEVIIAEARAFPFRGSPELFDILKFLDGFGFSLFDIFDPTLRPSDGYLGQFDIVAVRTNGFFRTKEAYKSSKTYRTPEQVKANIEGKLKKREAVVAKIRAEMEAGGTTLA